MCVIEKLALGPEVIYPRKSRRCFHGERTTTRKSPRVYDHGGFRDSRCHQHDHSRPRQETPPAKPVGQTLSPDINLGRTHALRGRGRASGFHMPFTKTSARSDQNNRMHWRQNYQVSPGDMPGDFPEDITYECRSPRQPASPVIRSVSPLAADATVLGRQQRQFSVRSIFREPRTQGIPRASRQPRERTPVHEREPFRRHSGPVRIVEVNHLVAMDSSRGSNCQRCREPQQEQFPREAHRDKMKARTRRSLDAPRERSCERARRESFHCHNKSFAGHRDNGQKHGILRGESNDPRKLTTRGPGLQRHLMDAGRAREAASRQILHGTSHNRPQIIRDGHRQISETGARICMEGRVQQRRESSRREEAFDYREPRNRASNHFRVFDPGDHRKPYGRYRQYGWRFGL